MGNQERAGVSGHVRAHINFLALPFASAPPSLPPPYGPRLRGPSRYWRRITRTVIIPRSYFPARGKFTYKGLGRIVYFTV